MITFTVACPYCHQADPVIRHGTTEAGTMRCRCKDCRRTFAYRPKSRAVTPDKEEAILRQLNERTSIRGVCRALKVSPNTVYATLKKK